MIFCGFIPDLVVCKNDVTYKMNEYFHFCDIGIIRRLLLIQINHWFKDIYKEALVAIRIKEPKKRHSKTSITFPRLN